MVCRPDAELRWNGGGVILGLQAGVFGRFRLEVSSSDLVACDWIMSLPAEAAWASWSGRLTVTHWSAHIGDEMIEDAGARRLDYPRSRPTGQRRHTFFAVRFAV